ncbi:enoyl-CoA hydratase/isomerase family protein [Variovorax terrae]|uniref:Enoyl-CoA hydratase/isomerase family protein n=1 Tax=Variovorax terrae TaxID=2923278 RepID=A0A9X1VVD6_9BURK|nr:enoyl-CoA hydratase/isomerase family protein [Variovorax terrae]MCJ0762572.1 enoyl-CoA hydratase/isomerase family protein [Variovorax terrae]
MIDLRHEGATAVLTLMRRERGNALGLELVEALIGAVEACIADPAVHTLAITADGDDFCTGFDLGGFKLPDGAAELAALDGALLWRFVRIEHLLSLLWHAPLRTVAVAHGRAFGAGADLFAACDLRLAAPGTQWRFPGAAFGIVLGTRRLGEQVGTDRALAWVTTGALIPIDEALAQGLATGLVPDGGWRRQLAPLSVGRPAYAALRAAARSDRRNADLAALVRSAMQPGLARRIAAYRDALRRPPPASAGD